MKMLRLSVIAILIADAMCLVAKFLSVLIDAFVNLFFFGRLSMVHVSPGGSNLGLWVIAIPPIGGLIVGLMAFYWSKAIRGHGIPEAMEQILTNESRIKPSITFLKPLSAAISIGTGGPFGAEGPIIATGGALGSSIGQLLKITATERKILLSAGATAGMAAIFGSPIAGICLAIELLLFEFSPRAMIPVALACITGAAGHRFLFGSLPVFEMPIVAAATNTALAFYSVIGISMGFFAAFATRLVYWLEDGFEGLPIHWMFWPAIGGIVVGVVGFFAPQTLGVGYENISAVLSGTAPLRLLLVLCFLKFASWAVSLSSGTSGGTLAPLLTIGGAGGALMGAAAQYYFPSVEISIPLSALVGMAAMFAGASRALLTSILFAVETTGQIQGLLPVIAASTASYIISFFLMKTTIMTEKIARRGVTTPDSYRPDVLETTLVSEVMSDIADVIHSPITIAQLRKRLAPRSAGMGDHLLLVDAKQHFLGVLNIHQLYHPRFTGNEQVSTVLQRRFFPVNESTNLREAVEIMAREGTDVLPVTKNGTGGLVVGLIRYRDVIRAHAHSRHS